MLELYDFDLRVVAMDVFTDLFFCGDPCRDFPVVSWKDNQ